MKLSQFTDYSLRALLYLSQTREEVVKASEIANCHRVSYHHMVKVLHKLRKLGYVSTRRGQGGGVWLTAQPEAIQVGHVVRETEIFASIGCLQSDSLDSVNFKKDRLGAAISEAHEAFCQRLDQLSIADLMPSSEEPKEVNDSPVSDHGPF